MKFDANPFLAYTDRVSNLSAPKKRFTHLLCDLDGTLIDSGGLMVQFEFIWRTLPLMKRHQGWKAAYEALKEGQEILKTPSSTQTNEERVIESFQKHLKLSKEEAKAELKMSLAQVFPKLKSHFGEIKDAAQFLKWAKDQYSLTLATNPVWSLDLVQMRMRWGGIDPAFFDRVTTADRMHACKPCPEYYREVLAQESYEASDCLLIGNERKMDLPATQVGIAVFLIRPEAASITCIEEPSPTHPGAWRGSYPQLKLWLIENQTRNQP